MSRMLSRRASFFPRPPPSTPRYGLLDRPKECFTALHALRLALGGPRGALAHPEASLSSWDLDKPTATPHLPRLLLRCVVRTGGDPVEPAAAQLGGEVDCEAGCAGQGGLESARSENGRKVSLTLFTRPESCANAGRS